MGITSRWVCNCCRFFWTTFLYRDYICYALACSTNRFSF